MTVQQRDESKPRQPIVRDPDEELQLTREAPGPQAKRDSEPGEKHGDDQDRRDGGNSQKA